MSNEERNWNPIFLIDEPSGEENLSEPQETPEDVQKLKVGENEYTQDEISALIDKANRYDPLEKDYTRKSQRLAQYEKDKDLLDSAKNLYGLIDKNPELGTHLKTLVAKAIAGEPLTLKEQKELDDVSDDGSASEKRLMSKIEALEKKISGFDSSRQEDQMMRERESQFEEISKEFPVFKDNLHARVVLESLQFLRPYQVLQLPYYQIFYIP